MTSREGFLASIAAASDDDTPRLIFADWLDERDDPLGEFIRLQIELEPFRQPCDDPIAELERVKRLHRIPPGQDHPSDEWPLARQLERERQLLQEHKAAWLGEAAPVEDDHSTRFKPDFRRGFVASAEIGLTEMGEHGEEVRRACPALQRLVLLGTLGRGEEIASCIGLAGLPELLLAGWLSPDDAAALVASPHLRELRSLTVWIGADDARKSSRALTRLPSLRELTLVQMWGGMEAEDPDELDRQADALVAHVRKARPELLVRLERPYERRFPLDGIHIGYGINAGRLNDGQAVLVDESKQPVVMYFDSQGQFVREEQLDLRDRLVKPPAQSWEPCDIEELIAVLGQEIGFAPGPIFVHEFQSDTTDVGVRCWDIHEEELESPGMTDPEEGEEIAASLYWWWSSHQFVLDYGNNYWADGLGRVHSS